MIKRSSKVKLQVRILKLLGLILTAHSEEQLHIQNKSMKHTQFTKTVNFNTHFWAKSIHVLKKDIRKVIQSIRFV